MTKPKTIKPASPWQPASSFDEPGYREVFVTDGRDVWRAYWYSSFRRMQPDKPFTHWMSIPLLPAEQEAK